MYFATRIVYICSMQKKNINEDNYYPAERALFMALAALPLQDVTKREIYLLVDEAMAEAYRLGSEDGAETGRPVKL